MWGGVECRPSLLTSGELRVTSTIGAGGGWSWTSTRGTTAAPNDVSALPKEVPMAPLPPPPTTNELLVGAPLLLVAPTSMSPGPIAPVSPSESPSWSTSSFVLVPLENPKAAAAEAGEDGEEEGREAEVEGAKLLGAEWSSLPCCSEIVGEIPERTLLVISTFLASVSFSLLFLRLQRQNKPKAMDKMTRAAPTPTPTPM